MGAHLLAGEMPSAQFRSDYEAVEIGCSLWSSCGGSGSSNRTLGDQSGRASWIYLHT